ncbi:MAG: hypothetical protein WC374_08865 [Phycisphaerae bacterium]|jgi:hypothetical protein
MNTPHECLTAIETWYELKYTVEIEIKAIIEFLRDIPDLDKFFFSVTSRHSKKWKSLPDLAIMREINAGGKNPEIFAEIWWQKLLNRSSSYDVMITDPSAFFVVSGYGSWDSFCEQRDGDYRELTHKDFVKRYVSAMESGVDIAPRVLPGYYGVTYGIRKDRVAILGDETRGRELLAGAAPTMIENLTSFIQKVPEAE